MRKIKVVVLLVQQLQHGFTKNAKVSPNLTVAHIGPSVSLALGHRMIESNGKCLSPNYGPVGPYSIQSQVSECLLDNIDITWA